VALTEILDVEQSGVNSPRVRSGRKPLTFLATIGLTAITALLVVEVAPSSTASPQSLISVMANFCSSDVGAYFGPNSYPNWVRETFATVRDVFYCGKQKIGISTFYYRTAFDENRAISIINKGFTLDSYRYQNPPAMFVGKGFISLVIYPSSVSNPTEGVVIQQLAHGFGVKSVIPGDLPVQTWEGILPKLSVDLFSNPKPIPYSKKP